jgi:hypothetical protein
MMDDEGSIAVTAMLTNVNLHSSDGDPRDVVGRVACWTLPSRGRAVRTSVAVHVHYGLAFLKADSRVDVEVSRDYPYRLSAHVSRGSRDVGPRPAGAGTSRCAGPRAVLLPRWVRSRGGPVRAGSSCDYDGK